MDFDVFISYSSRDKPTADAGCAVLEGAGIRCWMAPRDIVPGSEYGAAIVDAIDHCRAVVLFFSSDANVSPQIHREVERAVKRGVPIVPMRIDDSVPTASMAYFMESVHWLDAITPPVEQHLRRLAEALKSLLKMDSAGPPPLQESIGSVGPGSGQNDKRPPPLTGTLGSAASRSASLSALVRGLAATGMIILGLLGGLCIAGGANLLAKGDDIGGTIACAVFAIAFFAGAYLCYAWGLRRG